MAEGMGSRFGGLKQIEPVDPEGHIIIDFSLFDAWRAGFRDFASAFTPTPPIPTKYPLLTFEKSIF